jgi:hypothetical protein
MIMPQELAAGRISHALGINATCANAPSQYPSDMDGTDTTCDGSANLPHYGNLMRYIAQTDQQIAASSRSVPCKAILTAMHDYGAYWADTGDNVARFDVASEASYISDPQEMGQDPYPTVYAELSAAGDGSGGNWYNCMNGLSNMDFEIGEILP